MNVRDMVLCVALCVLFFCQQVTAPFGCCNGHDVQSLLTHVQRVLLASGQLKHSLMDATGIFRSVVTKKRRESENQRMHAFWREF